jgi:hypothetical protein
MLREKKESYGVDGLFSSSALHQLADELESKGAREGSTIPSHARGIARV